jgi:hypothetical protein
MICSKSLGGGQLAFGIGNNTACCIVFCVARRAAFSVHRCFSVLRRWWSRCRVFCIGVDRAGGGEKDNMADEEQKGENRVFRGHHQQLGQRIEYNGNSKQHAAGQRRVDMRNTYLANTRSCSDTCRL